MYAHCISFIRWALLVLIMSHTYYFEFTYVRNLFIVSCGKQVSIGLHVSQDLVTAQKHSVSWNAKDNNLNFFAYNLNHFDCLIWVDPHSLKTIHSHESTFNFWAFNHSTPHKMLYRLCWSTLHNYGKNAIFNLFFTPSSCLGFPTLLKLPFSTSNKETVRNDVKPLSPVMLHLLNKFWSIGRLGSVVHVANFEFIYFIVSLGVHQSTDCAHWQKPSHTTTLTAFFYLQIFDLSVQ